VFGSADADNSGTISLQELTEQIGEKAAQELWRRVDLDGDGEVTLEELQHAM